MSFCFLFFMKERLRKKMSERKENNKEKNIVENYQDLLFSCLVREKKNK